MLEMRINEDIMHSVISNKLHYLLECGWVDSYPFIIQFPGQMVLKGTQLLFIGNLP